MPKTTDENENILENKYKKCHINYVFECRLFIKEFFRDNEAVYLEVSI